MQGLLPRKVPSKSYAVQSESCDRIQEIASNLPKLLLTGRVQSGINKLSPKDLSIDGLLRAPRSRVVALHKRYRKNNP